MDNQSPKMKPIWFFVGIMLFSMGLIVTLSGVYDLINPNASTSVLSELHPNIWWGGVMMIFGIIFYVTNKNETVN